ncbi:hypothetical protein FLAG1_05435 [Fusarium langsethiae]|uniref:Uncharacterized protein n=1 Tax=Fusarium langsethiae TaxID=179993 RepID=A0A0M9EXK2_FUSLA|nr:hypothetical protein FLAG1_05435 [Fusarium langsethiae]
MSLESDVKSYAYTRYACNSYIPWILLTSHAQAGGDRILSVQIQDVEMKQSVSRIRRKDWMTLLRVWFQQSSISCGGCDILGAGRVLELVCQAWYGFTRHIVSLACEFGLRKSFNFHLFRRVGNHSAFGLLKRYRED